MITRIIRRQQFIRVSRIDDHSIEVDHGVRALLRGGPGADPSRRLRTRG